MSHSNNHILGEVEGSTLTLGLSGSELSPGTDEVLEGLFPK